MTKLLIGLGYQARTGKDTIGQYLVERHGFKRIAFADKVREVAGVLTDENPYDLGFKTSATRFGITGGELLQIVGSELRRSMGDQVWILASRVMEFSSFKKRIVVTDVRYPNEAAYIKGLGGVLVRVTRPGQMKDSHETERLGESIQWDYTISNNGTLEQLYRHVEDLIATLENRHRSC